jgi:hypothetical protein
VLLPSGSSEQGGPAPSLVGRAVLLDGMVWDGDKLSPSADLWNALKAAILPGIGSQCLLLSVLAELLSSTMDALDEKHVLPAEKVLGHDHASPSNVEDTDWREQESFRTRNGLNLRSFGRRPVGDQHVVLDKSMKTRHLHMIAIGGSIGAGFFVGSGGALSTGVSLHTH